MMSVPKKCTVKATSSRTRQIPLAVLAIVMTACFVLLAVYTAASDKRATKGLISEPVFSKECGFYDDEFYLEIGSEDGYDVYYTTDGSDPDISSIKYEQPILIRDATQNENVWSMRTDLSTGFYSEIIEQLGKEPASYLPPDFLIDKCTIVRAVCISENGLKSRIVTKSYFVDFQNKSGYDKVYTMSIVTDPDNLFDYHDGIYVTGAAFDDYLANDDPSSTRWWCWNANYRLKGKKHEKAAHIDLYDPARNLCTGKEVGIRIQGGASRAFLPKSFNIYAREKYDGEPVFSYDFFTNGYSPGIITLFAGGNTTRTNFNDYLMSSFVSDRDFATMHYVPCVAFLDGEYWGVYWITEKYDERFIEYYYGTDADNLIMIKNGEVENGSSDGLLMYQEMRTFIEQSDMTVEANYQKACSLIDIESFIDYYAAQCYIARYYDWPKSNYALWRSLNKTDDAYSDGKWRWMLFDVNSGAFELDHIEEDTVSRFSEEDAMFGSMIKNKTFEKQFYQTLLELAENNFTPEKVQEYFDYYKSIMPDALKKEYDRFYGKDNTFYEDELLPKMEEMEQFLDERNRFIINYCHSRLDA